MVSYRALYLSLAILLFGSALARPSGKGPKDSLEGPTAVDDANKGMFTLGLFR